MAIALQKSWIFAPLRMRLRTSFLAWSIARCFYAFNRHDLNTVERVLGIRLARFLDRFRDAKKQSIAATSVR